MQVDGLGERNLIDSGGFPVVWIGDPNCTIGQDPSQGGTNCYGPGDVLVDADTGAQYQIGSDWHLRQLGGGDSVSSAPAVAAAPTLSDRLYYVDSGQVVEKDTWSDGSVTYSNTGMSSPLSDGTASGNPSDLQQTTASSGAPDGSGFQASNPGGGYGPYATPDPPQLRDLGTYVQNGRLYDHQVDQYGNDYYQDVGAAPSQAAAVTAPSSSGGAYNPLTDTRVYQTINGPKTVAQMYSELKANGWPDPPGGTLGPGSIANAYMRAAGGAVTQIAGQNYGAAAQPRTAPSVPVTSVPVTRYQAPGVPTVRGAAPAINTGAAGLTTHPVTRSTPAISTTGNFSAWLQQATRWLEESSFIQHVPNGLLVAGGAVGYSMLRRRRRRF